MVDIGRHNTFEKHDYLHCGKKCHEIGQMLKQKSFFLAKQMDKLAERLLEMLMILLNMTKYPAFFRNNVFTILKAHDITKYKDICCLCCYKGAEGTWLNSIIGGGLIYRWLCWNIVGIKWPQLFSEFAMEYLQMRTKGNSCFLRWKHLLMQLVVDCTIK